MTIWTQPMEKWRRCGKLGKLLRENKEIWIMYLASRLRFMVVKFHLNVFIYISVLLTCLMINFLEKRKKERDIEREIDRLNTRGWLWCQTIKTSNFQYFCLQISQSLLISSNFNPKFLKYLHFALPLVNNLIHAMDLWSQNLIIFYLFFRLYRSIRHPKQSILTRPIAHYLFRGKPSM